MAKNRAEYALAMIDEGCTAQEILKACGYKNITSVYNLAKSHKGKLKKAHADKHEAMRKYKAEGHTMSEVAKKFSVSEQTAQMICKGIAPQKAKPPKDGYKPSNKGILQDIENVKRIINERAPGFEYAGNYTGSNGHVDLRCKKCGYIHTHGWHSIRVKGVKTCPNCIKIKQHNQLLLSDIKLLTKKIQKICDKRGEETVRLLTRAVRLHRCPVCGKITDKPKYCSKKCSQKAQWATHDANRRTRIKAQLIDKDISLQGLYKRDNGVCAICGGKCDWSDCSYKGQTFIVGKNYPSIDHIIPLSKGGSHSWDNVQLAHHGCNTAKGASLCG